MESISVGEIQKNIALLTKLTEAITIVDKRKNKRVAVIYPIQEESVIDSLAGKYHKHVQKVEGLEQAKEQAFREAMREKYGVDIHKKC